MKLPPSKFFLAGEELFSFSFFNSRLYPFRREEPKNSNYFYYLGGKLDVVNSERLDSLENFYFEENKALIEAYVNDVIDNKLKKLTKEVVHKSNTPLRVLVDEIIPACNDRIFEKKAEIKKNKVKEKIKINENDQQNFVENLYNDLLKQSFFYKNVLGEKDFIVINKKVYSLEKTPKSNIKSLKYHFSFYDSLYGLKPKESLENIESIFQKKIGNFIDNKIYDYINNYSSLDEELNERKRLNSIGNTLKTGAYEYKNIGLFKKNSSYYIYFKLPKYVLKNFQTGDLYLFNSVKVGLQLKISGNSLSLPNKEVVILDRYKHPYVWDNDSNSDNYQKCCYGSIPMSHLDREGIVKKVRGALLKGYSLIYHPSMKKGPNPVHRLNDTNFWDQKITESRMKRLGLKVTNVS